MKPINKSDDIIIVNTTPRILGIRYSKQFVKDFAEYYHYWLNNIERSNNDIDYWFDCFQEKYFNK